MPYIYRKLNTNELINDLMRDEYAGWTHAQARELVAYFEDLAEDLGEAIEWDTVAIRCSFSVYDDIMDFAKAYRLPEEAIKNEEDVLYFVHNQGATLLQCDDGSFIVEDF